MQDVPNLPSAFYCGYFDCTIFGELSVSPKRTRRMYEIEYYLEKPDKLTKQLPQKEYLRAIITD